MRKADNLPPSCAVVTKSGNLNFVEHSAPVTGLLYLYLLYTVCVQNLSPFGISVYRGGIIESGCSSGMLRVIGR